MINLIDIVRSWNKASGDDPEDHTLASIRASICLECPSLTKNNSIINLLISKDNPLQGLKCNECGCPISKKIYSQFGCPIDKW